MKDKIEEVKESTEKIDIITNEVKRLEHEKSGIHVSEETAGSIVAIDKKIKALKTRAEKISKERTALIEKL